MESLLTEYLLSSVFSDLLVVFMAQKSSLPVVQNKYIFLLVKELLKPTCQKERVQASHPLTKSVA